MQFEARVQAAEISRILTGKGGKGRNGETYGKWGPRVSTEEMLGVMGATL